MSCSGKMPRSAIQLIVRDLPAPIAPAVNTIQGQVCALPCASACEIKSSCILDRSSV
eukprot:CAMPEP_0179840040 /NCGR_PEP_ID=MMETSP0982-20121206/1693_1 /TAXON_ID=483367 /ORGANISM="non described non described, Strain CCMP 2436" /LENGTH=56 /DNA_ID=CAMNT_0021723843 /DNA_START=816 /DNA_END=986 /DNA_ORIENTATION=+